MSDDSRTRSQLRYSNEKLRKAIRDFVAVQDDLLVMQNNLAVPANWAKAYGVMKELMGEAADSASAEKTSGGPSAAEPGITTTGHAGGFSNHEPARGPEEAGALCDKCDQIQGHEGSCTWTKEDLAAIDKEAAKMQEFFGGHRPSEARPSARRHHCTACGISHSGASSCDAANACSTCAGDGKVIPFRSVEDYPETEANPCPRCEGTGLTERYRRWRAGERMNEAELCACPYGSPCALHPRTTDPTVTTGRLLCDKQRTIGCEYPAGHAGDCGHGRVSWNKIDYAVRPGPCPATFALVDPAMRETFVCSLRDGHAGMHETKEGVAFQGPSPCTDYPGHTDREALVKKLSAIEAMRKDFERDVDFWKTRALRAERQLDDLEMKANDGPVYRSGPIPDGHWTEPCDFADCDAPATRASVRCSKHPWAETAFHTPAEKDQGRE